MLLSRKKGKLREPKTCRIFFSSPFGGMEEEREELTRKYFPQIQHACNAKGVQFVAVDMRWGITSQAAENAQVINICLREVDRSDIFVGFFGQRYGWHGADDKQLQENFDNAVGTYPWLDNMRDRSVTELEFLHGHLNHPGDLPACICFRDKTYDDVLREEGLATENKKQVFKYSSESDHATSMMDDLKDRIKATESKCLGVKMAYSHPHEGAQFMFESIWPYLTEVLLANVDTRKRTKREQKLEEHDAFRATRMQVYKGAEDYMNFLDSKLEEGQGYVLISGCAGIGKSALLCNWTARLVTSHPQVAVIYHFVGCAPGTTDAGDILERLLMEVKHISGDKTQASGEVEDVQKLQQLFLGEIERVVKEKQKQIVIVLDGLNRLPKGGKTSEHLYWIPHTWPQGVLFVTSTVDTDADTFKLLVNERNYHTLTVNELTETSKREICVEVLKKSGKELSPDQLSRIVAAEQTSNPLYLRLVVTELSIFGYFRLLDKKIDSLINCSDVEDLLQNIFTRLEEDYNGKEQHTRLVQEVLCAIELSRHGLQEKELMEMLEMDSQMWLPLYFAMEDLLVSHAGLLRFAFDEISQAVRAKYLRGDESTRIRKKLIGYFDKQLKNIPVWEDLLTALSKRPVEELPWLQRDLGDFDGLTNTLLNMFVLHQMEQEYLYEFFELWKMTGREMSKICDLYLSAFDMVLVDLYLHQQDMVTSDSVKPPGVMLQPLLRSIENLFDIAPYPKGIIQILMREVDILMNVKGAIPSVLRFDMMMATSYRLACALVDSGNLREGETRHRDVMESCRSFLTENPDNESIKQTLGFTCNGVGVVCVRERRWDEAIVMFEESIKHHSPLGNNKAVAEANTNLGLCYMEKNEHEKGLACFLEVLHVYEEMFFGHLPLELGNLLTNIGICYRRLGDFDKAEAMYRRSLEVKINAVGPAHNVVAMAYMNMNTLYMHKEDYAKAEEFIHKCLKIQEGNGATLDSSSEFRKGTENMISCLLMLQRTDEALSIYLPLFHKLKEVNEMDYCIASVHGEMAKYLLQRGDADTAREITLALINSKARNFQNYIFLDHLQSMLPEDERPQLPADCTLEHAFYALWPGDPNIARWIVEKHALPAGDIETILKLQEVCLEHNQEWGAYVYEACTDWCETADNKQAAVQVLEAGLKKFPENLNFLVRHMDLSRKIGEHSRAYPHLSQIIDGKKDDPACILIAGDIAVHCSDYQLALQCFDKVSAMHNPQLAELADKHAKILRDALSTSNEDGNQQSGNVDNAETQQSGNVENGEKQQSGNVENGEMQQPGNVEN